MHFKTMSRADVPQGRNGKHNDIVKRILEDLAQVREGAALKIPLDELAAGKDKVRSALNRETRKRNLAVGTASDDTYLYVWNEQA